METEERTQIRAEESRMAFFVSAIFSVILLGTLIYVWSLFSPIAPRETLNAWAALIILVIGAILAMPVLFLLRKPGPEEILRIWSPAGKVIAVAMDVSIAASIWLLLPYASEGLRLLMVIFYMAAISGQVIATAESLGTNAFGILVLPGSVALFYFMTPGQYSNGIAIFCLAFGGLLMMAAVMLKQSVRSAFRARLRAEEVAAQLVVALEKAEQERDSKARFIAAASHDLRQPLHAATLYFEQSQIATDETVRARAVKGVRNAFQAAGSLLDSLLDHLRLGSDTVRPAYQDLSLTQLWQRLDNLYSAEAAMAGMKIRFRPTPHCVRADEGLLIRALGNLLSNAIKHSRGERILVTSRQRGDQIELFVIDDGVGIAEQDREVIFDEYVQGSSVVPDPRGGLGLGLASSQRIAQLHRSELKLSRLWKGGAAFSLLLPSVAPSGQVKAVSASSGPCPVPPHLKGKSILIVEDDQDAGDALRSLLASWGIASVCVGSALLAGRFARQQKFDALISDWRLSMTETGADVIRLVRNINPDIPVMVLTGDGSPETVDRILSLNVVLLQKPATPDRLLESLTEVFTLSMEDRKCSA